MNTPIFIRFVTKTSSCYTQYRYLSRTAQKFNCNSMSTYASMSISKSKERETFNDVLPCIVNSLVTSPQLTEIPDVAFWIKKVLEYNLTGGKKTRGLTTVIAYEMLERPENITEESVRLARIMGWCVEMLQAYLIVADDMMDGSTTRRGLPCWYRLPDVGLGAINDSILLYTSLFHTLKTYFRKLPQYAAILDLFNETVMLTSAGQHLDLTMAHRNKKDYSVFTMERYHAIIKYKTAFYSYNLPVCLGLLLANVTDETSLKKAEEMCIEIGKLFQMQDDFIDCFSDESVTGKAGTDIQEGKCSWLAVMALQRCNPAQRALFEECFASKDPAHVERVKQLYADLQIPQLYKQEERACYDTIVQRAQALNSDSNLSPKLFLKLTDMIYKRNQ